MAKHGVLLQDSGFGEALGEHVHAGDWSEHTAGRDENTSRPPVDLIESGGGRCASAPTIWNPLGVVSQ
ncbi:MAG: hypothetical protein ABFD46_05085 [Armatimonadota bacterium]